MIAMPLQLFVVRTKHPFASKDKTVASFLRYLAVDPVFVDNRLEINDRRSKMFRWYGIVADSEYIEGKLAKQVARFLGKGDCDFLICFKPLPLENRIVFSPRFVRTEISLTDKWDVEDRRPIPYKFVRAYSGFFVDHNVKVEDAQSLIR